MCLTDGISFVALACTLSSLSMSFLSEGDHREREREREREGERERERERDVGLDVKQMLKLDIKY